MLSEPGAAGVTGGPNFGRSFPRKFGLAFFRGVEEVRATTAANFQFLVFLLLRKIGPARVPALGGLIFYGLL